MQKVEARTQIGTMECHGCGHEVPIKVNVAGCVYAYCCRVIGTNEETGKPEKCFTRFNWGRSASQRMIKQYLETLKEETEDVQFADREATTGQNNSGEPAATDGECGDCDGTPAQRSTIGQALGNLLGGGGGESLFD